MTDHKMAVAAPKSGRLALLIGAGMSLLAALACSFIGVESATTLVPEPGRPAMESRQTELPASARTGEKRGGPPSQHRDNLDSWAPATSIGPPRTPGSGLDERPQQSDQRTASKLIEGLREIAASYDPKRLAEIESHLYSRNPAIRAEAVDAVLNLGDASGAEMLRRASHSMSDPNEESETLAKAAFLRLPSGSFSAPSTPK